MSTIFLVNIIGWIGALSLLAAYLLVSRGKIPGRSYLYQGLNIIGSLGFIINSGYFGAIPSVGLNTIWLLIGIVTIFKINTLSGYTKNEEV